MRWTIKREQGVVVDVSKELLYQHLRLFPENGSHPEDTSISQYLEAATSWAEGYTRREIAPKTVELYTDCLPHHFDLPASPVISVESVEYLDINGDWVALDAVVDEYSDPPYVQVESFPDDWAGGRNSIKVVLTAGYESIPSDMLSGLLLLCGHWFENRESVVIGAVANQVPQTVEALLYPFRALDFER